MMEIEDQKFHGWQEDITENWVTPLFPEDITELLVDFAEKDFEAEVAEEDFEAEVAENEDEEDLSDYNENT